MVISCLLRAGASGSRLQQRAVCILLPGKLRQPVCHFHANVQKAPSPGCASSALRSHQMLELVPSAGARAEEPWQEQSTCKAPQCLDLASAVAVCNLRTCSVCEARSKGIAMQKATPQRGKQASCGTWQQGDEPPPTALPQMKHAQLQLQNGADSPQHTFIPRCKPVLDAPLSCLATTESPRHMLSCNKKARSWFWSNKLKPNGDDVNGHGMLQAECKVQALEPLRVTIASNAPQCI